MTEQLTKEEVDRLTAETARSFDASPVPRGLITRRARRNGGRAAPLVRRPVLLPRILEPA